MTSRSATKKDKKSATGGADSSSKKPTKTKTKTKHRRKKATKKMSDSDGDMSDSKSGSDGSSSSSSGSESSGDDDDYEEDFIRGDSRGQASSASSSLSQNSNTSVRGGVDNKERPSVVIALLDRELEALCPGQYPNRDTTTRSSFVSTMRAYYAVHGQMPELKDFLVKPADSATEPCFGPVIVRADTNKSPTAKRLALRAFFARAFYLEVLEDGTVSDEMIPENKIGAELPTLYFEELTAPQQCLFVYRDPKKFGNTTEFHRDLAKELHREERTLPNYGPNKVAGMWSNEFVRVIPSNYPHLAVCMQHRSSLPEGDNMMMNEVISEHLTRCLEIKPKHMMVDNKQVTGPNGPGAVEVRLNWLKLVQQVQQQQQQQKAQVSAVNRPKEFHEHHPYLRYKQYETGKHNVSQIVIPNKWLSENTKSSAMAEFTETHFRLLVERYRRWQFDLTDFSDTNMLSVGEKYLMIHEPPVPRASITQQPRMTADHVCIAGLQMMHRIERHREIVREKKRNNNNAKTTGAKAKRQPKQPPAREMTIIRPQPTDTYLLEALAKIQQNPVVRGYERRDVPLPGGNKGNYTIFVILNRIQLFSVIAGPLKLPYDYVESVTNPDQPRSDWQALFSSSSNSSSSTSSSSNGNTNNNVNNNNSTNNTSAVAGSNLGIPQQQQQQQQPVIFAGGSTTMTTS